MYEPASLGMFQCRLQRILCDFEVIMFFRKDPPQTEGRRHADLLIKTEPDRDLLADGARRITSVAGGGDAAHKSTSARRDAAAP